MRTVPREGSCGSPRRLRVVAAFALLRLIAGAGSLAAQSVQGRVVSAPADAPVAGALVVLVDSAGSDAVRTASTASGGFMLTAPRPGLYRIAVRQIGMQTWQSTPLRLAPGPSVPLVLRIDAQPFELPAINVEARRPRCGIRLDDDETVSRLLDVAQTALALAQTTADEGALSFAVEGYAARYTPVLQQVDSVGTGVGRLSTWPIQSAPPDTLQVRGFVRTDAPGQGWADVGPNRGPVYYGLDARVLFSDWFLATHCFRLDDAAEDELRIRFTPGRGRRRTDVEGSLALDRATLELRRIGFSYVGLPDWIPGGRAGGEIRLRRLPSGAWVPYAWRMRAPVPQLAAGRSRPRVDGWLETGGWVRSVRGPDGRIDSTLTRAVLGR